VQRQSPDGLGVAPVRVDLIDHECVVCSPSNDGLGVLDVAKGFLVSSGLDVMIVGSFSCSDEDAVPLYSKE